MISIKQSVNDLEQMEQVLEKSIQCFRDAVRGFREHAFDACTPIAGAFRQQLVQLERRLDIHKILGSPTAVQILQRISDDLLHALNEFSNQSVEIFRQDTSNLRDILSILGATAELLNSQNLISVHRFHDFSKQLEDMARIDDLTLLRRSLSESAVEFRRKLDEVSEEGRATIASLQRDVLMFRQKLDEAEMQAATDTLTGAFNRRELQRQIDMRIESAKRFSLLMFDLDEFKSTNDRFGHVAGDHVLKYFAQTVKASIRPGDVVARWGGDEFIVLVDAGLDEAIVRLRQIFVKLKAPVAVQVRERTVMLPVRASSGVAEHHMNESAQGLFARVDSLLYANKSASRPRSAV